VFRLLLFVVCLFLVPWLLGFVLPSSAPTLQSFLATLIPVVWTPTLLTLVFLVAEGGPSSVARELRARLQIRCGYRGWLAAAVTVPVVAVAIGLVVTRAAGDAAPFIPSSALATTVLIQVVTGAIGEELGWRGYVLSRLEPLVGSFAAVWIMGVLWSSWHIGAFFNPSLPHYHISMVAMLPFIALFGVFLGTIFFRAGNSVLATMAAHLTFNILIAIGGAVITSSILWATLSLVFALIAVPFSLSLRRVAMALTSVATASPT